MIRLKSFPSKLLNHIHLIDPHFLDDFEDIFTELIEEIRLSS